MKFTCEKSPELRVAYGAGQSVKFRAGQAETTDKAAIEALKALPAEVGVKPAGGARKRDDN